MVYRYLLACFLLFLPFSVLLNTLHAQRGCNLVVMSKDGDHLRLRLNGRLINEEAERQVRAYNLPAGYHMLEIEVVRSMSSADFYEGGIYLENPGMEYYFMLRMNKRGKYRLLPYNETPIRPGGNKEAYNPRDEWEGDYRRPHGIDPEAPVEVDPDPLPKPETAPTAAPTQPHKTTPNPNKPRPAPQNPTPNNLANPGININVNVNGVGREDRGRVQVNGGGGGNANPQNTHPQNTTPTGQANGQINVSANLPGPTGVGEVMAKPDNVNPLLLPFLMATPQLRVQADLTRQQNDPEQPLQPQPQIPAQPDPVVGGTGDRSPAAPEPRAATTTSGGSCPQPMSSEKFPVWLRSMTENGFETTTMSLLRKQIPQRCLRVEQLKQVLDALSYESNKLEIAKLAHPHVFNPDDYYLLFDAFTFDSSVQELQNSIR